MPKTLFGRKIHGWRNSGPQECSSLTLAGNSGSSRGDAVSCTPAPDLAWQDLYVTWVCSCLLGTRAARLGEWGAGRV